MVWLAQWKLRCISRVLLPLLFFVYVSINFCQRIHEPGISRVGQRIKIFWILSSCKKTLLVFIATWQCWTRRSIILCYILVLEYSSHPRDTRKIKLQENYAAKTYKYNLITKPGANTDWNLFKYIINNFQSTGLINSV